MLRSRSHRLVRVTFLWMGLMLVLPLATADAATKKTTTRQRVSARHSASQSRVAQSVSSTSHVRTTRTRSYSATRATARRARYYRAKAAAYARDARALSTPLFKTDAAGEQVPDIRAEAAIIYNPVTH